MQKLFVGIVVGTVIGVLFGASVVAPRLTPGQGEPAPERAIDSESAVNIVVLSDDTSPAIPTDPNEPSLSDVGPVTLKWELASAFPSDLPLFGDLPQRLEQQIETLSGGRNSVRFHEPDRLAPVAELMDAVRSGAVDVAFTAPILDSDQIPALGLFGGSPFGPTATELLAWLYAGGGMEELENIYHDRALHVLPCGLLSAESGGWFRKKLSSIENLNGLRMRIDGLGAKVVARLGVEIIPLAVDDIASAFETGQIDAAEASLPSVDLALGIHATANVYYFPGWHQRTTLLVLIMRLDTWQSLSPVHQGYLSVSCGDNTRQSLAEGEATQFDALKNISGSGVEVLRLPVQVLDALREAWRVTEREQIEQDEEFARTWHSLSDFRRDFDIWSDLNNL